MNQAQKAPVGGGGAGRMVVRVHMITHICNVGRILPSISWIELHCGGKLNNIMYNFISIMEKNKHTTADSAKPLVFFL